MRIGRLGIYWAKEYDGWWGAFHTLYWYSWDFGPLGIIWYRI